MRDNQFLSKINPIITFFVVLAVVLGATFLTLRWVESRKAPAAPVVQAPKADQAPQQEKKEQPAQENNSENKQEEPKSAETQQPTAQQPEQASTTDENKQSETPSVTVAASSSSDLPGTGLSLGSIFTFIIGAGITIYLSLTIHRQKLALRP